MRLHGKPGAPARKQPPGLRTLAIDVGGTGIKAVLLDERDHALAAPERIKTPQPATPAAMLKVIQKLARDEGRFDRIALGFPGVVKDGVVQTAHNLDPKWVGFPLLTALRKTLAKPVRIANDAAVQGMGVVKGRGVELVLTLGTGLGSALFLNGQLVPNLELAHHPFRHGKTYEDLLGNAALKKVGKKRWNRRLGRALKQIEALFNPDHIFLGGGNATQVSLALPPMVTTVANAAGLYGGLALWEPPVAPRAG